MANLDSESWFKQTPQWVYLSFVPVLGALIMIWEGIKAKMYVLSVMGIALVLGAFIGGGWLIWGAWVGQIALAFILKQEFLVRTYPNHFRLPSDHKLAQRVGQMRGKVDINTCSKDDLVRLGVPIAYVNDIFTWRESGHIFTHIEELGEMVGIPSATLQRIAPLVIFTYNPRQEAFVSWRRANNFSQEELLNLGLRPEVVQKLIEGRASGTYKSLLDITKRTGITIDGMRELI